MFPSKKEDCVECRVLVLLCLCLSVHKGNGVRARVRARVRAEKAPCRSASHLKTDDINHEVARVRACVRACARKKRRVEVLRT